MKNGVRSYIRTCHKNLLVLLILGCYHLPMFGECGYLHLDKQYLIAGESLYGSLFSNKCGGLYPQVRIVLQNQSQTISESWIRLDSSIQPFTLEVPAATPEGLYSLLVFVDREQRIISSMSIPIFKPLVDFNQLTESRQLTEPAFNTVKEGLDISWDLSEESSKIDLTINPQTGEQYTHLSIRISDQAQSTLQELPQLNSPNTESTNKLPLSSHTFALEGYLSDSAGNGCNYCQVVLTIPNLSDGIYYSKTDATGSFAFTGLSHTGIEKGYLSYNPDPLEPVKQFFLHQRSIPIKSEYEAGDFQQYREQYLGKLRRYTLTRKLSNQISEQPPKSNENPLKPYQEIQLYPKRDYQILFDEFHLAPDMKKTLKSIVPFVNTIKKSHIRVFSTENSRNFEAAPLILLDGIPINSQQALAIDPRTIYKAEVINKRRSLRQIGNLAIYGVLSLVTKNGTDETKIPGVQKVYVRGYDNPEQESVVLNATHSFDRVVYWNPSIYVDKNAGLNLSVPIPPHYTELVISVIGADDTGDFVFFQGILDYQPQ